MEKYTKAQMEVIEFENEDVVTRQTSRLRNVLMDGVLLIFCGSFERYMG
ncbi:MAG: hypothetical protein V8S76_02055 [Lachnospiraceae bacterium]